MQSFYFLTGTHVSIHIYGFMGDGHKIITVTANAQKIVRDLTERNVSSFPIQCLFRMCHVCVCRLRKEGGSTIITVVK
jgi:ferredoxin